MARKKYVPGTHTTGKRLPDGTVDVLVRCNNCDAPITHLTPYGMDCDNKCVSKNTPTWIKKTVDMYLKFFKK